MRSTIKTHENLFFFLSFILWFFPSPSAWISYQLLCQSIIMNDSSWHRLKDCPGGTKVSWSILGNAHKFFSILPPYLQWSHSLCFLFFNSFQHNSFMGNVILKFQDLTLTEDSCQNISKGLWCEEQNTLWIEAWQQQKAVSSTLKKSTLNGKEMKCKI